MNKLIITQKNRMIGSFLFVAVIFASQFVNASITHGSYSFTYEEFSDEELLTDIKSATSKLTSLFNEELGIFVWNVQNPLNLSRYGDLSDSTNSDEGLEEMDIDLWLTALTQDISMQYLLLKNNVEIAFHFVGDVNEEIQFNRKWLLLTEQITSWLFYRVAINDELINILSMLATDGDGFGAFWDYLIRPKYNDLIGKEIALLPETLVLGSKILKAIEFMPYFTFYEHYSILLLSDLVSNWWQNINRYALSDPRFAVAGIGESFVYNNYENWIGWKEFKQKANNNEFDFVNIYSEEYTDFLNMLYTSPEIANIYITYLRKFAAANSVIWDKDNQFLYPITNPAHQETFDKIIDDYTDHITWIEDQHQYLLNPGEKTSWIQLDNAFTGYSYVWDKYFIDSQGSISDFDQYFIESPLKRTEARTFQGAGDIRGLMEIFKLLSQGFTFDNRIQMVEKKAILLLQEILDAKRVDSSFLISPYFGTSIGSSLVSSSLLNDATLVEPTILPKGMNKFIGTISALEFITKARNLIVKVGSYPDKTANDAFEQFKSELDNNIIQIGDLLLNNIDERTMGIPKQSIVCNELVGIESPYFYSVKTIKIQIDLTRKQTQEMPNWIFGYDDSSKLGRTNLYQWDYLFNLKEIYLITEDTRYIDPAFNTLLVFCDDYNSDGEYQITSICEGKDPIARYFFKENYDANSILLCDNSGYFTNTIPYSYRTGVLPVSSAFATETPQRINGLLLSIMPQLFENLFGDPMNQVVMVGFISGVIMTIAVVYYKRPKHQ